MPKQYLFYDLETSGINPVFDQVYQFGAILTDDKFNEIERYEIDIKQRPDVVCAPGAMKTTMLSINHIQKGLPEYEGIKKIHALLNKPNTINIGYNTLGYDDKILRFSFFRNLLSPYTHQFKDGCSRADILPVAILYFLYQNDVIQWPYKNDKFSLKLENINALNKLYDGTAHNALVDTIVTLELTKVFNKSPKVLNYFLGYFLKQTDFLRTVNSLKNLNGIFDSNLPIVNLANVKYGSDNGFTIPALLISSQQDKKTAAFLRLDTVELQAITMDNIEESTWIINKKYGDNIIVLPDDSRTWSMYDSDRVNLVNSNIERLKDTPQLLDEIKKHHTKLKFEYPLNYDLDSKLYETAFSAYDKDKKALSDFHTAPIESKLKSIDKLKDPIFIRLANRIILRNYPEQATPSQQISFNKYVAQSEQFNIPRDYSGNFKLTKSKAIAEIVELLSDQTLTPEQKNILSEYKKYLKK